LQLFHAHSDESKASSGRMHSKNFPTPQKFLSFLLWSWTSSDGKSNFVAPPKFFLTQSKHATNQYKATSSSWLIHRTKLSFTSFNLTYPPRCLVCPRYNLCRSTEVVRSIEDMLPTKNDALFHCHPCPVPCLITRGYMGLPWITHLY
jgi:hypothetical protein